MSQRVSEVVSLRENSTEKAQGLNMNLNTLKARTNKAGYTATPVACGWAGAVLRRLIEHLGRSSKLKMLENAE